MSDAARTPLSVPVFAGREREYLQKCIDDAWVAQNGPFVRRFEQAFAQYHDRGDAVSTTSGTAALHLALLTLGVGPGDEVVVPSLTFVASANPILYVGATPVFADVERATRGIDPTQLRSLITPRTKAIIIVHLYGHPADTDPLLQIAREHGIPVIEDATEALGSTYKGRLCGTFGDIACFSFNGNKLITTGGGGMVLSPDQESLDRIRHRTLQGRVPGREYIHDVVGFNYTMSNLQAAIGLAQFEQLEHLLERKREVAQRYADGLAGSSKVEFLWEAEWAQSNFWLQTILVAPEQRVATMEQLDAERIESRPFFYPIDQLEPYRKFAADPLPNAQWLHERGVCIPSSVSLDNTAQARVIDALLAL